LSLGGLQGRDRSALVAVGGESAKLKGDYLEIEQTEAMSEEDFVRSGTYRLGWHDELVELSNPCRGDGGNKKITQAQPLVRPCVDPNVFDLRFHLVIFIKF